MSEFGTNKSIPVAVSDSKTKLFVSKLPSKTTNEDLEKFFGEIGPLKHCFVITEKGTNKCKGFGYVQYAIPDDASIAKSKLSSKPFLGGSPILIDFSHRREKLSERKRKIKSKNQSENEEEGTIQEKTQTVVKGIKIQVKHANVAARVVVLSGLQVMDNFTIKSLKLFIESVQAFASEAPIKEKLKVKHSSIIPSQIEYPINGDTKSAYLLYTSVQLAINAVDTLNSFANKTAKLMFPIEFEKQSRSHSNSKDANVIKAALYSDSMLRKFRLIVRNLSFKVTLDEFTEIFKQYGSVYEVTLSQGKIPGTNKGFGFVNYSSLPEAETAIKEANGIEIKGRVIAVDWAVSKEQYQKHLKEDKEQEEKISEEIKSENEIDNSKDENSTEKDEEIIDYSSHDIKKQEKVSDIHEGKTLFVRNLPYTTSVQDFKSKFREFGKVLYAILNTNPETGESKGSGFVKFSKSEEAQLCLEMAYQSKSLLKELDPRGNKKNQPSIIFGSFSKLHSDTRTDQESDIILDGRKLIVSLAVDKNEAEEIRKGNEKPKDKRNLHLAEVGIIKKDSEEAKDMPAIDLQKRIEAWKDKKSKLANPNYHVSATRLAVRGIPKDITVKELKQVFNKAVLRGRQDNEENSKNRIVKFSQVKIATDDTQLDNDGNPTSRGFGFVEFREHEDAMLALHQTNNKPGLFSNHKNRRLIVDFALENSQKLQKHQKRVEKSRIKSLEKMQELNAQKPVGDGQSKRDSQKRKRNREKDITEVEKPTKRQKKNPKANKQSNTDVDVNAGSEKRIDPQIKQKGSKEQKNKKISPNNPKKRQRSNSDGFIKRELGVDINFEKELKNTSPYTRPKKKPKRNNKDNLDKLVQSYKQHLSRPTKKWDE